MTAPSVQYDKIFWHGSHQFLKLPNGRPLGSPLGKVHPEGLAALKLLGWCQVPTSTDKLPIFSFTTRKGADFPIHGPGLPLIRQLPQALTAVLDDKALMYRCLSASPAGHSYLPPTFLSLEELNGHLSSGMSDASSNTQAEVPEAAGSEYQLAVPPPDISQMLSSATRAAIQQGVTSQGVTSPGVPSPGVTSQGATSQGVTSQGATSQGATGQGATGQGATGQCAVWGSNLYLKHRLGVKGQSVYVHHSLATLQQQLAAMQQGSRSHFIIQQEVPPDLIDGRKYVLRCHVLVVWQAAQYSGYIHEDVVLLQHAQQYSASSIDRAVHVSSMGRGHPKPALLQSMPELHQQIWPQLVQLACSSILASSGLLFPPEDAKPDPEDARLYGLFGYDVMVNKAKRAVLLEVNAYPAIASGTMSQVDKAVYTGLISDLASLVVLPAVDGRQPRVGGFHQFITNCSPGLP